MVDLESASGKTTFVLALAAFVVALLLGAKFIWAVVIGVAAFFALPLILGVL